MRDADFEARADGALDAIEHALEESIAAADFERKPGGVLDITFEDGSRIIVNRHSAAGEIWLAARAGGMHFRWVEGSWRDGRSGDELFAALSREVSAQAGRTVVLQPPPSKRDQRPGSAS